MELLTSDKDIKRLEELTLQALKESYRNHLSLGINGTNLVKNKLEGQYAGDMSLRADLEAEEVVIDTFRKSMFPVRFNSEEHGLVDCSSNPKYFAVLDGLDGTKKYKAFMEGDRNARYGTMLSVFSTIDPTYDDYLTCGIMEHPTGRLFFSSKNKGGYILNLINDNRSKIKTSSKQIFDIDTRVIIDTYPGTAHLSFNTKTFVNKLPRALRPIIPQTSEASYADLSEGIVDLVLECTRKGNLEIAVAYGLLKEAGGEMVLLNGKSLGRNKYLTFGQKQYLGVISAASAKLAISASQYFNKKLL